MLYFDNQVQTAIKDGWAFCKRNQHEIDSLKSNIHGTGPVKIADVQEFLAAEKRWNAIDSFTGKRDCRHHPNH